MTRPYSNDLRSRVAASVLGGRTCAATAALFGVSIASAAKWSRRLAVEGKAAAKPMGGARRAALAHDRDWLLARSAAAVVHRWRFWHERPENEMMGRAV
jgi:transposase